MNVRSLVALVGRELESGNTFVTRNREHQVALNTMHQMGMSQMSNWRFSTVNGEMTVSSPRCCTRTTCTPRTTETARVRGVAPTPETNHGTNRVITTHGLTIPADLARAIRLGRTVYIRPVNTTSFLVMRERGNSQDTFSVRSYADGRLVLSRSTINNALGGFADPIEGDICTVAHNGNNRQSLLVTLR